MAERILPKSFVSKKIHSLMGLWLVVFLLEHLITNSQAALYIGSWGQGFVKMVNALHSLPYLQVVEILLLGLPLLVHGAWGIKYAITSKQNSYKTSEHSPLLNKYARNHAFTWQRITSYILLIAIILHVLQMRFLDYPKSINGGIGQSYYMSKLNMDKGLYTVAPKLGVKLYNQAQIDHEKQRLLMHLKSADSQLSYDPEIAQRVEKVQVLELLVEYMGKLSKKPLKPNQVMAVSQNFGANTLLSVRETFKSPLMITLYTIFVIAACFHAFNGLWTAMISWGITLTKRSQQLMRYVAVLLTTVLALLGMCAIWLTYFVNLRGF